MELSVVEELSESGDEDLLRVRPMPRPMPRATERMRRIRREMRRMRRQE